MKMILTLIKKTLLKKVNKNDMVTFESVESQHETPDDGQLMHSLTRLGIDEDGMAFREGDKPAICSVSGEVLHEEARVLCCGHFKGVGLRHIKKYVPEHRLPALIEHNPCIEEPCLGYCDECWRIGKWIFWKYKITTILLFLGTPFMAGKREKGKKDRRPRKEETSSEANRQRREKQSTSSTCSPSRGNVLTGRRI